MDADFASQLLRQPPRNLGTVALHHEIQVTNGCANQNIAHRAADYKDWV